MTDDVTGSGQGLTGEITASDFIAKGSRRQFLAALGSAGAAGLAGCAGGSGSGSTDDGTADEEAGAQTDSNGNGSTLTANISQRLGTIDPAKGTDYVQAMALVNLYDPLVFPDSEGEIQPNQKCVAVSSLTVC